MDNSVINQKGKGKENYLNSWGEITIKVEIPRKVCRQHEIMYFLMGEKCPYCKRLSISAYEQ